MASVSVKFRPSAVDNSPGTVYYQVLHNRRVRQISTEIRLFPCEWDVSQAAVKVSDRRGRREVLVASRLQIRHDVRRIRRIIASFEARGDYYTSGDVIDEFQHFLNTYTMFNFTALQVHRLKTTGRTRTAESYRTALNSFRRFRRGTDIMLDVLSAEIVQDYERWLRHSGLTLNSCSFYCRILRAVYNRAVESGAIEQNRPFRLVYTGVAKTVKRALPLDLIRRLRALDLSSHPSHQLARDMFLMSFYLRGMSFVDMAFLRKHDLSEGYITYCRRKTGQRLHIRWTLEMQEILDRYPENASDYLLPIIRNVTQNPYSAYRNMSYAINRDLKRVAGMAGISFPLTIYVARHSWASAARAMGIPLSIISESMGHNSEITTRIYLADLDRSVVDNANDLVIHAL